jgi:class 3 adenylate cyclase
MWYFTVMAPDKEPQRFELKPGKLSIGRSSENEISITDPSASRKHAELVFDPTTLRVSVVDLNSTNGTYVNRQRIQGAATPVGESDVIRIGQVMMYLENNNLTAGMNKSAAGTHLFTRELLLESLDENAVLLYEISAKLNIVLDLKTALREVTDLVKRAMGVDTCEILLTKQLKEKATTEFTDSSAKKAIETFSAEVTPTAMYVPILSGNELLGLISMHRSNPRARPFEKRDLQLAIAISHQTALTIQRMGLLAKIRREEQANQLLQRFVSPSEAEFLLKDYVKSGELPGLREQRVTVLFSDIAYSTSMAEQLGTKHFGSILNNFYQGATDIAFRHGGIIKYLGDGILMIFMQPTSDPSPEEKAVMAGRELLSQVNHTGSLDPARRIVIGVAINSGLAMAGYVGTRERVEFVVLGDMVNVAYRMQDYARPYKIIVGPATVAAISHKYKFNRVGAIALKGRENSVQAYEVL